MAIKKKRKKGSGRKPIIIDWAKVNFYLKAGCNGAAIARMMGFHEDTLYNAVKRKFKSDFSAYRTQKMEEGVALMEGTIFKDALEKGGVDRIFWLKNKARWSDKQEITGKDGKDLIPSDPFKKIRENAGLYDSNTKATTGD